MKSCLSSRQSALYLQKANEIKVQFRDRKIIPELAEKYPNATIILRFALGDTIEPTELKKYKVLTKDKLIACLSDLDMVNMCKSNKVPFYWGFPIQNFYQLDALKTLGVCYVLLDAPLFFSMDKVKAYGIPVRAIPNVANTDGLPHTDGVVGTWMRPEDVPMYEEYVEALEFERCDQLQEQGLYRVYFEQKEWKVELGILVSDLNHIGNNRYIEPEVMKRRLNCGQRCKEGAACHFCWSALDMANADLLKKIKNQD